MILEQSTLQIAYTVSLVTSIVLCGILWRHRTKAGAAVLFCYVFAGIIWAGTQLANLTIDDYAVSVGLLRFWYFGIALGTAALFVFALQYTGQERYLGPKTYLALSIHPIYLLLFMFVNPGGYFFETIQSDPTSVSGIVPEYGLALIPHLVYVYGLTVVSALMFVDLFYRTRSLYRGQSLAVIGGSLLPAAGALPLIFGLTEFDPTPIVIPITSGLFTIAIVRYRLIDLVPIARDRVLETVNDGVFVIDATDRLIDINPEGRRILRSIDASNERYIGQNVRSLFDETELGQQYETITESREETTVGVAIGTSHFQATVTPIDDGRDRHVGWLLIAHDVTERKRREQRLEDQNERLDRFASLVSHDLRNPLTVADGYLELARETEDTDDHLEEVAQAHDRMETIIDDVLALARDGQDVTDPESVALESITERAWNGVETDGTVLTVDTDASILADPDRLQRLLENLFRNSIEHGPGSEGSTDLEVSVRTIDGDATGSTVGFVVEDDGVGIPPEEREQILEDGYSTGEEGTGFGLSIVESIAAAHGWSLHVDESATGGARFEFTGVETGDSVAPTEAISE